MNKPLLRSLAGGALMLMLTLPVVAQPGNGPRDGRGPRDGGRGQGRGDGPRRGPRAKGELNRVWHDIAELEGGKLALSKAQSAKVVALVLPISKRAALSDADARTLADKIEAILTPAQQAEIDKKHPRGPRGEGRGGEGRGGGGRGGDGPPRGQRPDGPPPRDGEDRGPRRGPDGDGPPRLSREDAEKVRPFMDALNPFYPPTGYASFKDLPDEFAKDTAKHYGERRTLLETLSKRAKAK